MKVCILTDREHPGLAGPEKVIPALLEACGHSCSVVDWQDKSFDFGQFDVVVVRLIWNYFQYIGEFRALLDRFDTEYRHVLLMNPTSVLRWNTEKTYLQDLQAQGFPTIPTVWVDQPVSDLPSSSSFPSLTDILSANFPASNDDDIFVIKPAVSGGSFGTFKIRRGDASLPAVVQQFEGVLSHAKTLIQPYVEQITEPGELSIVYFANRPSHAVYKQPKAGDFRVQYNWGGTMRLTVLSDIPPEAAALADRCLEYSLHRSRQSSSSSSSSCLDRLLYARFDMALYQGRWCVMEIELTEPSLYFDSDYDNVPRHFVEAFQELVGGHSPVAQTVAEIVQVHRDNESA